MKFLCQFALYAVAAASVGFSSLPANAQEYPTKPIQLVAAVPTGSATDLLARQLADKLGPKLGGTVIVINKPGGGGVIATDFVAKSAADGHTLLLGNTALASNPSLYRKLPYDPVKDFAGIALVADSPFIVVVNNQLGVKTMKELFALAKAKPKTINFASAGVGTATHLACELLARRSGVVLTHVPYANTGAISTDLQANNVQMMCSPPASILPLLRNGRVSIIGIASAAPMTEPIHVPSVKQSAGVDYIASQWFGVFAPEKTPSAVQQKLAKAVEAVLAEADFRQRLKDQGLSSKPLYLAEFDEFFRKEMDLWGSVVHAAQIKLD